MNWRLISTALLGLTIGALSKPALGETRIEAGPVSGLWTANASPYTVTGNITLANNDTLRIEPGVIVVFQGNFRFTISGRMMAEGTESDSIFIYGGGQRGSWRGLFFTGPGADRSHVSYCGIRFAYQGINLDDADPQIDHSTISLCSDAGITFNRSLSKVLYCNIGMISGSGMKIGGSSRPNVRYCTVSNCGNNGLFVNESSNPVLDHNTIDGVSDNGIHLSSAAPCSVVFNKILRSGVRGISVSESNGAFVARNVIDGSNGPGVFLYSSANVQFINNTILNSGVHGIQVSLRVSGTIGNNICENSQLYGLIVQGSNPTCDYNDLYSNGDGDYSGIQAGAHDMHIPSSLDGNYNPREGNGLINAGDPYLPPDPDGTRADIGAGFFNQNHPPEIRSFRPNWLADTTVRGDTAYEFSAEVVDPDRHFLIYKWFVNDTEEWRNVSFRRNFNRDGEYTIRLLVDDRYYLGQTEHIWHFFVDGSAVAPEGSLPEGYFLSEAYPNPFNGVLHLRMTVPIREDCKIDLLDLSGRHLQTVFAGGLEAGDHQISFDAGNLPSGEYLIRAEIGRYSLIRRTVLMK